MLHKAAFWAWLMHISPIKECWQLRRSLLTRYSNTLSRNENRIISKIFLSTFFFLNPTNRDWSQTDHVSAECFTQGAVICPQPHKKQQHILHDHNKDSITLNILKLLEYIKVLMFYRIQTAMCLPKCSTLGLQGNVFLNSALWLDAIHSKIWGILQFI